MISGSLKTARELHGLATSGPDRSAPTLWSGWRPMRRCAGSDMSQARTPESFAAGSAPVDAGGPNLFRQRSCLDTLCDTGWPVMLGPVYRKDLLGGRLTVGMTGWTFRSSLILFTSAFWDVDSARTLPGSSQSSRTACWTRPWKQSYRPVGRSRPFWTYLRLISKSPPNRVTLDLCLP